LQEVSLSCFVYVYEPYSLTFSIHLPFPQVPPHTHTHTLNLFYSLSLLIPKPLFKGSWMCPSVCSEGSIVLYTLYFRS
jgi:hypothetical protein